MGLQVTRSGRKPYTSWLKSLYQLGMLVAALLPVQGGLCRGSWPTAQSKQELLIQV